MPCRTIAELVKHAVSVSLLHLGVNVITRIAKFRNLLGKQFHTVDRVAKYNTLVDFQLGKQGVQAVDLLSFLNISIKLGDTAERKFFHEVDAVGAWNKLLAKALDSDREGGTKEADLMFRVALADDLFENRLEFG